MSDQPNALLSKQEVKETAAQIAEQLGETERKPIKQIELTLRICGPEFTQQALRDTMQIEAEGGMMLPDGSRRRTPGGVFFQLVKQRVDKGVRNAIFYPARRKKVKQKATEQTEAAATTPQETPPPGPGNPTAPPQRRRPALSPMEQLHKLQQAEDAARERFEAIKELPPEGQAGLSAALRELKSIREEIKLLRQKHAELR